MGALGLICPIILITLGIIMLLVIGVVTFGFNSIIKSAVPIALSHLPLNQNMQLWLGVPIPIALNATLMSASAEKPTLTNNSLAVGHIEFKLSLSEPDEEWDPDECYTILWLQDDGEVGELERAVQVYTDGKVNYAKAKAVGVGIAALGVAMIMFILAASLK